MLPIGGAFLSRVSEFARSDSRTFIPWMKDRRLPPDKAIIKLLLTHIAAGLATPVKLEVRQIGFLSSLPIPLALA